MSLISGIARKAQSLIQSGASQVLNLTQQRNSCGWTDWRMIKDYKKRMCVKKHAVDRIRLNTLRKNTILPQEFRDIASKELHENFPRDANFNRVVARCMFTSRGRGNVSRFRLSRIMFRHFADYNKLAGIQRALW